MKTKLLIITFTCFSFYASAQQIKTDDVVITDTIQQKPLNMDDLKGKSPIKASLYSAVFPGAGQIYNKKWWKAPIALGLVGTGIGFSSYYNGLQNKFRTAFLAELEGKTHEYSGILNAEQLALYQDDYKRKRDYSVALTLLAYILNIVDATVDAHLSSVRNDPEFTFKPTIIQDANTFQPVLGLNLNYKF